MSTTVDTVKEKLRKIKDSFQKSLSKRANVTVGESPQIELTKYNRILLPKLNNDLTIKDEQDPKYKFKEQEVLNEVMKALKFEIDDTTSEWKQASIELIKQKLGLLKANVNAKGKLAPPKLTMDVSNKVETDTKQYIEYVYQTIETILDKISAEEADTEDFIESFQSIEEWINDQRPDRSKQEVLVFLQSIIPIN